MLEGGLGKEHTLVSYTLVNLARMHLDLGAPGEAEVLLRQALPIQERAFLKNHARLAATKSLLGAALLERGAFKESEVLLLSAGQVLKGVSGPEAREAQANRARLTALYTAWGRPEKLATSQTP